MMQMNLFTKQKDSDIEEKKKLMVTKGEERRNKLAVWD